MTFIQQFHAQLTGENFLRNGSPCKGIMSIIEKKNRKSVVTSGFFISLQGKQNLKFLRGSLRVTPHEAGRCRRS